MHPTDEHVRNAVAGDADALTLLLRNTAPDVERTLNIGPAWQAMLDPADVMQVTYLEAFLQIETCTAENLAGFTAWLRQIARHNLHDAIRGLQRKKRPQPRRRLTLDNLADSIPDLYEFLGVTTTTPSRHASREELLGHLASAMDALPEDYAQALRLYDFDALPIQAVAERMNRSPGAVHMLRARALDRLHTSLGPMFDSLSKLP